MPSIEIVSATYRYEKKRSNKQGRNILLDFTVSANGRLEITPCHGDSHDGFVFVGSKPEMVADIAKALSAISKKAVQVQKDATDGKF